ncbi:hypothetical protein SO802_021679 [Lithocarpus litseifolius]|uniref:Endonuclease/exonuclease/phosphatase domain-containing protein n=1 Tax=Lithocarpus litseifolius TaxID=425828 RepID=A0AAW2CHP0_9ROSI
MIIMSWNCRGLGNRWAVRVLTDLVRKKGPTILFLMETKLSVSEMQPIKAELDFPSMLVVPSVRRSGGLVLLWKNEVVVDTQTYSPNHIDVHVSSPMQALWRLTGVYGHPKEGLKIETWRLLRHLRARAFLPWVYLGKWRHGDAFVEQRLDRAYASEEWRELYPQSKVFHTSAAYSDHEPILLNTEPTVTRHRCSKKIQRFEEKWVAHPECEDRVRFSWVQTQPIGSPMFRLFEKIKRCRMDLVRWSRHTFGNSRDHINAKQGELEELMFAGYGENLDRIHEVRKEINELMHHEEVFWSQRSRSIWLPARDKNTKFFHQRASQRQRKNIIEGLNDTSGRWCTDTGEIAGINVEYYKRLFAASNNLNMDDVLASVDRVVTEEMARTLVRPYTEEEVRTTLF